MKRTNLYDCHLNNGGITVPVDGAISAVIVMGGPSVIHFDTFDALYNVIPTYGVACLSKVMASVSFMKTGDSSFLTGAFYAGDFIPMQKVFEMVGANPETAKVRLLMVEYIPEKQCNCNH